MRKNMLLIFLFVIIFTAMPIYATEHIIEFGGTLGLIYSPSTLMVAVGDTVTWQGTFSGHPLSSTVVPGGASTFANGGGTEFSYVVMVAGTYEYQCDFHFASGMVGSFTATVTSLEENESYGLPTVFGLDQNYPNPFNPSTTIDFRLPESEFVTLTVFNVAGQAVTTLVSDVLGRGNYSYRFDGQDLASGVYFYQLVAGNNRMVRKMMLVR